METRKLTSIELAVFSFLNDLRESGITNMYGARPYIKDQFPKLSNDSCGRILSLWMKYFERDAEKYGELQISDELVKVKDI